MQHKDTKRITLETKRITTKTTMQTDEETEQKIKEHKDTTSEDVSDNLRKNQRCNQIITSGFSY